MLIAQHNLIEHRRRRININNRLIIWTSKSSSAEAWVNHSVPLRMGQTTSTVVLQLDSSQWYPARDWSNLQRGWGLVIRNCIFLAHICAAYQSIQQKLIERLYKSKKIMLTVEPKFTYTNIHPQINNHHPLWFDLSICRWFRFQQSIFFLTCTDNEKLFRSWIVKLPDFSSEFFIFRSFEVLFLFVNKTIVDVKRFE